MAEISDVFRRYNGPLIIEGAPGFTTERWTGIEEWASAAERAQIPELVDAVYGQGPGPQALWTSIQKHDESFVPGSGTPGTRLMSAAALDYLFTHSLAWDVPAALAITCAAFGDRKPDGLPVDIVARAEAELDAVADQRRTRKSLSAAISAIKADALAPKLIQELPEDFGNTQLTAAVTEVVKGFSKALEKIASETRKAFGLVDKQLALCDEECEVLWFVFAGDSDEAGQSFSELGVADAALLAAVELSDKTTIPLHSQTFRALLMRLGAPSGSSTPKAGAESVSPDWIASRVEPEPNPRLYPLHRILDRYRAFGTPGAAWTKGLQDQVGLSPSLKLSSVELALQFYRELMLRKVLAA